jgi:hypothetical protein
MPTSDSCSKLHVLAGARTTQQSCQCTVIMNKAASVPMYNAECAGAAAAPLERAGRGCQREAHRSVRSIAVWRLLPQTLSKLPSQATSSSERAPLHAIDRCLAVVAPHDELAEQRVVVRGHDVARVQV